jgi:hypothetical protein
MLGDEGKALAAHDLALKFSGGADFFLSMKASALGTFGRVEEARVLYRELMARAQSRWVDPFSLACAALGIGDVDAAIGHFEQGERDRSFFFLWFRAAMTAPDWHAALRMQPRIHALLHRIWPADFPEYAALNAARLPAIAN